MKSKLNIYRYIENTNVEGPFTRFAIWVQGCSIHCKGCFNSELWSFDKTNEVNTQNLFEKVLRCKTDIEGITILGGEPFDQKEALSAFINDCRSTDLGIIIFTGYTFEELTARNDKYINNILSNIDLLIDGPFDITKLDNKRPLVGSTNQKFKYLTNRYTDIIERGVNKLEIRIDKNGNILQNGMPLKESKNV